MGRNVSKLTLALALAGPIALVGCGGGGSSSDPEPTPELPGSDNGGDAVSPSDSTFRVLAEASATESCAALDATVAVHDANGNFIRTLTPGTDGEVALGDLNATDMVTILNEQDERIDAVSVVASRIPDSIDWTISSYGGAQGDCFADETGSNDTFELIANNADQFDSVEFGPTAKFQSSSAETPDRVTLMADTSFRALVSGYDNVDRGFRRLTHYGLSDNVDREDGDTVSLDIDTPSTPFAVQIESTASTVTTSWIDPDTNYEYPLEDLDLGAIDNSSVLSLNAIEPGAGEFLVTHRHTPETSTGQMTEVYLSEVMENTDSVDLRSPDFNALSNVSYSNGEVRYEFTDTVGDSERLLDASFLRYGSGMDGKKTIYHMMFADSVDGMEVFPDVSDLTSSTIADISVVMATMAISEEDPLFFDYVFGSSGIRGVGEVPEAFGSSILFGEFRQYNTQATGPF